MIFLGPFHHLGIATESIEKEEEVFGEFGYEPEGSPFCDPAQGVRGRFLIGPGPRLELLEPLGGSQTLTPWLASKGRIYHQAFEVGNVDEVLRFVTSTQRARILRPPLPAVAFGGRKVAFVMLRNRSVFELIQSELS